MHVHTGRETYQVTNKIIKIEQVFRSKIIYVIEVKENTDFIEFFVSV
jgi:hypothetical protein